MGQTADVITLYPRRAAPPLRAVDLHQPAVIAAHREDDRAELVSALLLAIEGEYLAPVLCYPSREGRHVVVMVGATPFRLLPDDCRTAARVLIDENAFAGCIGVAANLREAAAIAEADLPRPSLFHPEPKTRARTGMVSTLAMAAVALILAAANSLGGAF